MNTTHADLAFFTPAVKPILHRFRSSGDDSRTRSGLVNMQLGPRETAFISKQDSFYVATTGEDRWNYTQRHSGPKGFLRVLDASVLGFVSRGTSRRYITPGDALLFLIDHNSKARLKIWTAAEVTSHRRIVHQLATRNGQTSTTHLAFLFHVRAFVWGDEQHAIPCSAGEVHSAEAAQPGKSDPLSTNAMTSKRCLSLDAGSGVWTLNDHSIRVQI